MASLYQISEDILRTFNEIEINDGEITEEQENLLAIKEEELKVKLDSYVKAIKTFEADEKALKEEKKRFNDRQNIFKNRIERLRKAALTAVLMFGEPGKNNRFVETATFKLFTRSTKAVEVDEVRVRRFIEQFERFIKEVVGNDVLYAGDDVDLQGILDCINSNAYADYGDDFQPFTIYDLVAMKLTISQTASIYDLFKSGLALNMYGKEPIKTTMENATDKDDWKTLIEAAAKTDNPAPTMAKIVVNQSLQIK